MNNTTETENICGLKRSDFQTTIGGKQTDLYILKNSQGNEVAITNYGGAIVAIMVPDKNGKHATVIQGHDNIQDVINSPEPYLSTLVGRYGNRICKGQFQLNGKVYHLPINNGPNCLHGGKKGYNAKVWEALQMNAQTLVLKYTSPYGEEGFSGEVKVTVEYSFTDDNELVIEYMAKTNKKTVINLTSHGFFSLAGIANPTPEALNCQLQINADFFIPIDETSIPTGEILKVEGTPFDFRTPHTVGERIHDTSNQQIVNGTGYDHCYDLNKHEPGELSFAVKCTEPISGRVMEMYTTEPGVQFYSSNWLNGFSGSHGATFGKYSALCFEAQHFPDSPNRPYFPSVILKPGELYTQKTIYKFSTED